MLTSFRLRCRFFFSLFFVIQGKLEKEGVSGYIPFSTIKSKSKHTHSGTGTFYSAVAGGTGPLELDFETHPAGDKRNAKVPYVSLEDMEILLR